MFVRGSVSNLLPLPFLNMLKQVCLSFCAGFVRQQLTEKEDLLQAALEAKARFYPVLPRPRHFSRAFHHELLYNVQALAGEEQKPSSALAVRDPKQQVSMCGASSIFILALRVYI